jgi:hypothetical protein
MSTDRHKMHPTLKELGVGTLPAPTTHDLPYLPDGLLGLEAYAIQRDP